MALRALILAAIVGFAGIYARELSSQRVVQTVLPRFDLLPRSFDGWSSEDLPLAEDVAAVLDADATLQRCYRDPDGREVWLFLAYFSEQQVNSQIHSPRQCVPGSGWTIVALDKQALNSQDGPESVSRMFLERGGAQQEMLYWFRTRSGTVTGEYSLKLDLVRNALARRPTDALFVRYLASRRDSERMRELVSALDPALDSVLGEIGL